MPFAATQDGTRDSHTKSEREKQIPYDIIYMWNLKKKDTNKIISKTEIGSQRQKRNV